MKLFITSSALAFTGTAIAAATMLLLPTSYAKLEAMDVASHVTPELKVEMREKIQPVIDKYFKNLSTDKVAGDQGTKRDMLMDRDLKVSQQCRDDLTDSAFVTEMNQGGTSIFPIEAIEASANDSPVWTSHLLISSLLLLEGDAPIPNGFCVRDKNDNISCNAALFPSLLEVEFASPVALRALMIDIPLQNCTLAGGALVHSSFSTDCFGSYDINKLEFFGIPQCVPQSCELKKAQYFWKKNIKKDFEELGLPLDECRIKFMVDTKLPKKGKATEPPETLKSNNPDDKRKLIRSSNA